MKSRKCGSCNMCCQVFDIEELNKAQGVRCEHLRTGCNGCAIYERRPDACRAFDCLWVKGIGPARMRPDRSGVVLTSPGGMTLHAHALSFDKIKPSARRFLHSISDQVTVVLVAGDRRKLLAKWAPSAPQSSN